MTIHSNRVKSSARNMLPPGKPVLGHPWLRYANNGALEFNSLFSLDALKRNTPNDPQNALCLISTRGESDRKSASCGQVSLTGSFIV